MRLIRKQFTAAEFRSPLNNPGFFGRVGNILTDTGKNLVPITSDALSDENLGALKKSVKSLGRLETWKRFGKDVASTFHPKKVSEVIDKMETRDGLADLIDQGGKVAVNMMKIPGVDIVSHAGVNVPIRGKVLKHANTAGIVSGLIRDPGKFVTDAIGHTIENPALAVGKAVGKAPIPIPGASRLAGSVATAGINAILSNVPEVNDTLKDLAKSYKRSPLTKYLRAGVNGVANAGVITASSLTGSPIHPGILYDMNPKNFSMIDDLGSKILGNKGVSNFLTKTKVGNAAVDATNTLVSSIQNLTRNPGKFTSDYIGDALRNPISTIADVVDVAGGFGKIPMVDKVAPIAEGFIKKKVPKYDSMTWKMGDAYDKSKAPGLITKGVNTAANFMSVMGGGAPVYPV